ncbi:MAG TPA: hypothetical protein VFN42_06305 [Acetobacteraceae bacterium]|nr:hypothetical protein [Acetobacteraceae bacterium]
MAAPPLLQLQEQFDEAGYLRLHPDVAQAIASGIGITAWQHYLGYGKRERRRPNDVDPDFYGKAYPLAAAEIAAGGAVDAAAHYLRFGQARGYRPNAAAPRPAPPTVFPGSGPTCRMPRT